MGVKQIDEETNAVIKEKLKIYLNTFYPKETEKNKKIMDFYDTNQNTILKKTEDQLKSLDHCQVQKIKGGRKTRIKLRKNSGKKTRKKTRGKKGGFVFIIHSMMSHPEIWIMPIAITMGLFALAGGVRRCIEHNTAENPHKEKW